MSLVTLVVVLVAVVAGDLVLENMVMRTKKFRCRHNTQTSLHMLCDILLCSPQDNEAPSPMVGGGILERKIISAR